MGGGGVLLSPAGSSGCFKTAEIEALTSREVSSSESAVKLQICHPERSSTFPFHQFFIDVL